LEGWDEVGERHDGVLYDFGSEDERRVVLWMMNELYKYRGRECKVDDRKD
jgi:hypothetical protein